MIILTVVVLSALGLLAASSLARPASGRQSPASSLQPPASSRSQDAPTPARSGGPPGLLLRREPEIRGLPSEALADYVTTIRFWLAAGNNPTEAWQTSYRQAQAEVLLRTRVRRGTGDLTRPQLDALTMWLETLRAAGMPLDTDEEALRLNLSEDRSYRDERAREDLGPQLSPATERDMRDMHTSLEDLLALEEARGLAGADFQPVIAEVESAARAAYERGRARRAEQDQRFRQTTSAIESAQADNERMAAEIEALERETRQR